MMSKIVTFAKEHIMQKTIGIKILSVTLLLNGTMVMAMDEMNSRSSSAAGGGIATAHAEDQPAGFLDDITLDNFIEKFKILKNIAQQVPTNQNFSAKDQEIMAAFKRYGTGMYVDPAFPERSAVLLRELRLDNETAQLWRALEDRDGSFIVKEPCAENDPEMIFNRLDGFRKINVAATLDRVRPLIEAYNNKHGNLSYVLK